VKTPSALVWSLVVICSAAIAHAEHGTGSLFVAGATHTPTHWNIPFASTTAEIRGVSTSEVGNPLPPTIVVFVKSSSAGNVQITAVRIGLTNDYTFTYTPTNPGPGGMLCGTTAVAYARPGLNTNNDLLDDGQQNGSSKATCGFRFVDAVGRPLECIVGVESLPWGLVKTRYR